MGLIGFDGVTGCYQHHGYAECQVQLHLGSAANEVIVQQKVAVDPGKEPLNRNS